MILSIQYLRALAACMVVLFHCFGHLPGHAELTSLTQVGAAGVDIFFVISGFIMWVTTAGRDVKPAAFLRNRATRIVPLYWIATLVMFAMPFISGTIAGGVVADPFHLIASLLFVPRPSPGDFDSFLPIYTPGWTINYEMYFYLIFAICLMIQNARLRMLAMIGALFVIVVVGLADFNNGLFDWLTSPILIEFAAGIGLGALYRANWKLPLWVAFCTIAAGIAGMLYSASGLPSYDTRAFIWGIPAALIIFGALQLDAEKKVPEVRSLHLLGDASYALYLTHLFSVGAVAVVWHKFQFWAFGNAAYLAAAFSASIAAAVLVHRFVENPLLHLARTKRRLAVQPV